MSFPEYDFVEAYIWHYYKASTKTQPKRYFYLALNGSRQDEDDYLVWVETDSEGRILDRKIGRNWGKMNKREYWKRFKEDEFFQREDGTYIIPVRIRDDHVLLEKETSEGENSVRIFNVRKPWLEPEEPLTDDSKEQLKDQEDLLDMFAEEQLNEENWIYEDIFCRPGSSTAVEELEVEADEREAKPENEREDIEEQEKEAFKNFENEDDWFEDDIFSEPMSESVIKEEQKSVPESWYDESEEVKEHKKLFEKEDNEASRNDISKPVAITDQQPSVEPKPELLVVERQSEEQVKQTMVEENQKCSEDQEAPVDQKYQLPQEEL